jgi:tetratricopeptide (TPR) repeat protein
MRRGQRGTLLAVCLLAAASPGGVPAALGHSEKAARTAPGATSASPPAVTLRLLGEDRPGATHAQKPAVRADRLPLFDGRLCALEEKLFSDAADGRLDEFPLFESGLIASGVEETGRLAHYRRRFDALVDDLLPRISKVSKPTDKARTALEFLHARVLTGGYQLESTDLRAALDEGRFNCVSASVLFGCLAGACGLDVCGLEMPGHAMSRLRASGPPLDVETTCARWFNLLDDPAGRAEAMRRTLGEDLSRRYAQAREVSPVEMTAMIYYNRGVDLLAASRFEEAAVANAKALRLDPSSTTARGNLLATINNWAIALSAAGRYAKATGLLRTGMSFDPTFEAFSLNFVHVHHEWSQSLCRDGRFGEAVGLLERAATERPDLPYFQASSREVYRRWTAALQAAGGAQQRQSGAPSAADPYLGVRGG